MKQMLEILKQSYCARFDPAGNTYVRILFSAGLTLVLGLLWLKILTNAPHLLPAFNLTLAACTCAASYLYLFSGWKLVFSGHITLSVQLLFWIAAIAEVTLVLTSVYVVRWFSTSPVLDFSGLALVSLLPINLVPGTERLLSRKSVPVS
ncbi:MAG: hypothetical protein ACR2IE_19600 [Candidatus Sumerlaeaceae bacterium]